QRDLAVSPGLFRQVVINDQGILAAVAVVLAHRATGVRREVLHGSRIGSACGNDDRVFHGAVFFELAHDGGDRRLLLADGNVDTLNAGAFLVDDRVDGDSRFTNLAVTDDQLALAAAD